VPILGFKKLLFNTFQQLKLR